MRFLAQPAIAGIFAALVVTAVPAYAQVVGGSIGGTITDSSGAAVRGATVVIHNQETGSERQLTTNGEGVYSAPSVPVGRYSVSAARDDFATQHRDGIVVTVGQSVRVNVALSASAVSQNVEVTDKPAPVNLTTQQTSGLVDERQVKNLPLNGRSYDQLLTLNPATVNYTAQRSGSIGTSNSSVGNMFSVSGRRPQDNLFLLNGVEYTGASLINVTPGGTSGQLLGVDAVREFNVSSDTYSAAFGKRQGAQISIVTASGTNQLHGAAYEFLRNSALDARNYFDQQQIPEFQRNNFGGSLGGPIRRDKVFLFGNYEGYRQNLGLSNVALVPDANARQGLSPDRSRRLTRQCRPRSRCRRSAQALAHAQRPRTHQHRRPAHRHRASLQQSQADHPRRLRHRARRLQPQRKGSALRRLHRRRLHRPHPHRQSLRRHRRDPARAGRQH